MKDGAQEDCRGIAAGGDIGRSPNKESSKSLVNESGFKHCGS